MGNAFHRMMSRMWTTTRVMTRMIVKIAMMIMSARATVPKHAVRMIHATALKDM
jgi:hypothetical protein